MPIEILEGARKEGRFYRVQGKEMNLDEVDEFLGTHKGTWNKVYIIRSLEAFQRVIDTSGAGDVFHGAYIYSYLVDPGKSWDEHFRFARAASCFKIQHLGNEAGLYGAAYLPYVNRLI